MKFSVIIPTYGRINFLERAIESVVNQTCQNYEIIVINDNPADKDKVDDLITKFEKTKVIHHLETKGGNAARNSGILNSNGELIAFLDDDDLWLPQKLAAHLNEHQQNPNVGLVYSNALYVYNNRFIKNFVSNEQLPSNVLEAMRTGDFCPSTSSMVSIRQECVKKCGLFDETLQSIQDWDYWFRIAHVFEFSHIPMTLVNYYQHVGNRTSQNENKRRQGINQICNKWRNEIDTNIFKRNHIQSIYFRNSRNALIAGQRFNALKKSFKLLRKEVISKKSIKNFIKILYLIIKGTI